MAEQEGVGRGLRVATVQLEPRKGEKQENFRKARELMRAYAQTPLDLIVLPELAFIGYCFDARKSIEPLLDPPDGGETREFCASLGASYGAMVISGHARRREDGEPANSLIAVSPEGRIMAHYDKAHLYYCDEKWGAVEGSGFATVLLPQNVKACLAICMDINPYRFEAPWEDFELANFAVREGAHVVIMSSAWCNAHPLDDEAVRNEEPSVESTLTYWVKRLEPLIGREGALFVCADRIGSEWGVTFCGSSCVVDMSTPVRLLGCLSAREEGVLVKEVSLPGP